MKTWIPCFLLITRALGVRLLDQGERFVAEVFDVSFEYSIEAFNVDETSVNVAQSNLNAAALTHLTDLIPGDSSSVQFLDLVSKKLVNCTSIFSNGRCAVFKSTVTWSITNGVEHLVERATLLEVEEYIDSYNIENEDVAVVTFLGPSIVSTSIVVRLRNTDRIMGVDEIDVFESTLLEILNLEGDVVLTSVKVFLQQMKTQGRRSLLATFSNDVYLRVDGRCKGCSSGEFDMQVNDAVDSGSSEVEEELKERDEGNYFDNVTVSTVSDDSPSSSAIVNGVTSVTVASTANTVPFFLLYCFAGAVTVVLVGSFLVTRRRHKANEVEKLQSTDASMEPDDMEDLHAIASFPNSPVRSVSRSFRPNSPERSAARNSRPNSPERSAARNSRPNSPERSAARKSRPNSPVRSVAINYRPKSPGRSVSRSYRPNSPVRSVSRNYRPNSPERSAARNHRPTSPERSHLTRQVSRRGSDEHGIPAQLRITRSTSPQNRHTTQLQLNF